MNLRNFFKSSHTLWLEREYDDLKRRHAEELDRLKSTYVQELDRVIKQCDSLRDELQRTRLLISPGLQSVSLPGEDERPDAPTETTFGGTPWQRVLKREIAKQEEEWAKRHVKSTSEGESKNGCSSA